LFCETSYETAQFQGERNVRWTIQSNLDVPIPTELEEWKIKNERIVPFKFVYACKPMLQVLTPCHLVGSIMGERGGSETNTLVGGIEVGIEVLAEGMAS
jgi:hypothetical protein